MSSAALILAVALAAWALFQLRMFLVVGAGYKAKVLCSNIFGSGRDLHPSRAAQISADSYWILRPFSVRVDQQSRTVTASLPGIISRSAVHRDGLGATLLVDRRPAILLPSQGLRFGQRVHQWETGRTS